jgi:dihydrofolate reductase
MSHITVINNLTLDGVMQAPGCPDEDRRDGFGHGGRAAPYHDDVRGRAMTRRTARGGGLMLGRRTYTPVLNERRSYVASTTLAEPLPWENSVLLRGNAVDAVAGCDENLGVLGSGDLVRALLRAGLVDELAPTIHPLVLGSGRRMVADDGTLAAFRLVDAAPTTTGVLIATYEPETAS